MSQTEEKDFTISDRRTFAGEGRNDSAAQARTTEKEEKAAPQESAGEAPPGPLPEMNFATFIFSMSTSTMVHLGIMADPYTGESATNLDLAKQTIDLLGMLQEKTKGNLDENEEQMLQGILYDLRMKFVEASRQADS